MKEADHSLAKIVELLNDGQVHDGTSIGEQLHITRAAVWKAIKKLIAYGIPIQSAKGKGYQLAEPLILLNPEKIKNMLQTKSFSLEIIEKIDSTNDYTKKIASQSKKPIFCLAETQTAGRGRMSRAWHSPFGKNIYFSLSYPFQKDISELSGLSLVVGLAVCQAIENACLLAEPLTLKWPNDVLANGKKLAGILIEIQAESHGICHVIIGIGINANIKTASKKEINQPWTSLYELTTQYQDRNKLTASLIKSLLNYLKEFDEHDLNYFMPQWKKRDCLFQKTVNLKSNETAFSGIGSGINEQGQLILTLPNKTKKAFASGDTSLMKD